MKLYVAPRAPNPRRVLMFLAEKGIQGVERVSINLNAGEQNGAAFRALSPMGRVPVLVLDDGRALSESRAICTYLEGLHPEPNLMGATFEERAFIEMHDRHIEWYFGAPVYNWVRHVHPGLAALEKPQFPDFGHAQEQRARACAKWLDGVLTRQPWMAGERFTVADITAFCILEFLRLMHFKAGEQGYPALQAWRDRVAARPSAQQD